MFAEEKLFYKFEIVYTYDPDFHLLFNNVDMDRIREEHDIMSIAELDEYMERSNELFMRDHRIENVLFESREKAISFLHDYTLGEIEEDYCGEWNYISMEITIQDMPDDNSRFLVYEKDYLVALLKLKTIVYSFV